MIASDLLDSVFATARANKHLSSTEILQRAGLHASAISRIRTTGDCRLSTLEKLLRASGLKLVVVEDSREAELLAKGELF